MPNPRRRGILSGTAGAALDFRIGAPIHNGAAAALDGRTGQHPGLPQFRMPLRPPALKILGLGLTGGAGGRIGQRRIGCASKRQHLRNHRPTPLPAPLPMTRPGLPQLRVVPVCGAAIED